ncbi:unnamed protein product, partial [Amoebophrya sp. A25]
GTSSAGALRSTRSRGNSAYGGLARRRSNSAANVENDVKMRRNDERELHLQAARLRAANLGAYNYRAENDEHQHRLGPGTSGSADGNDPRHFERRSRSASTVSHCSSEAATVYIEDYDDLLDEDFGEEAGHDNQQRHGVDVATSEKQKSSSENRNETQIVRESGGSVLLKEKNAMIKQDEEPPPGIAVVPVDYDVELALGNPSFLGEKVSDDQGHEDGQDCRSLEDAKYGNSKIQAASEEHQKPLLSDNVLDVVIHAETKHLDPQKERPSSLTEKRKSSTFSSSRNRA